MYIRRDKGFSVYLQKTKWFVIVLIALATAIGLSKPDAPVGFPPAGSMSDFVVPFSYLAIVVFWMFPWLVQRETFAKCLAICSGVLVVILLLSYMLLVHRFVIPIDIPAKNETMHAIVGYRRKPLAERLYGGMTDAETLKRGGFDEEALNELYTDRSRSVVLLMLFSTYLGIPAAVAMAIGSAGRLDQLRTDSSWG